MQGERASQALRDRVNRYLALLRRVRRHRDPDTIHDFRVASRNLLALYRLFPKKAVADRWRKKVRRRLKRLNRLRDLQVLRERLDEVGDRPLDREIGEQHEQLNVAGKAKSRKRLRSDLKRSARKASRHIRRHPKEFEAMLRDEWFRIHHMLYERLQAVDAEKPETLHRLRVAFKDFRYMSEFLADAGALQGLDREQLKDWQDLLGDIQDDRVAVAWLDEHPEAASAASGETAERAYRLRRGFIRRRGKFRSFIDSVVW